VLRLRRWHRGLFEPCSAVARRISRRLLGIACRTRDNEEGRLPPEPPLAPWPCRPRQAGLAAAFFRRRENAATAPAPNRITIDGSGTLVPELEP
jgi:hypothetical protein